MIAIERAAAPDRGATEVRLDAGAAAASRDHFDRHHWIVIPGLFGPRLLEEIAGELERAEFEARDYDGLAGELALSAETASLVARLLFLVNDTAVYDGIAAATGLGPVVRYDGRVYRRVPRPDHYDNWPDDLAGAARLVAMSVNLGGRYEGGVLELRRAASHEPLGAVHNAGPGDALLFRIDPALQHRVSSVSEGVKTALAGWFGSAPPWPYPARPSHRDLG